jgi:hypothetical protein
MIVGARVRCAGLERLPISRKKDVTTVPQPQVRPTQDDPATARDDAARERDRAAEKRRDRALQRDQRASLRDVASRVNDEDLDRGFADRALSARDRDDAAADRADALDDARAAGADREAAALDRQAAASAAATAESVRVQYDDALVGRTIIGQAQGILMAQQRITAEQAFDQLRAASQARNVKLRAVAEEVVETGMLEGQVTSGAHATAGRACTR